MKRALFAGLLAVATPAAARDSLGMFDGWGAFRDSATPQCYAIAKPRPSTLSRETEPFATIATWPRRGQRGVVHLRLSRALGQGAQASLTLGGQRFALVGTGPDVWSADPRMDAAIVAAMRSAATMSASGRDRAGRGFVNTWELAGAASAMDAATLGCARLR